MADVGGSSGGPCESHAAVRQWPAGSLRSPPSRPQARSSRPGDGRGARRTLVTPVNMFSMCEEAERMEAAALPEVNHLSIVSVLPSSDSRMSSGRCERSLVSSPRGPLTTMTRHLTERVTPSGTVTEPERRIVFCTREETQRHASVRPNRRHRRRERGERGRAAQAPRRGGGIRAAGPAGRLWRMLARCLRLDRGRGSRRLARCREWGARWRRRRPRRHAEDSPSWGLVGSGTCQVSGDDFVSLNLYPSRVP